MMESRINPYLTEPDLVVLRNLLNDAAPNRVQHGTKTGERKVQDQIAVEYLNNLNNPDRPEFQPTVFLSFDEKHIPPLLNRYIVRPYTRAASKIVRRPTDIVFLTHIILYFSINLPSAIWLFYRFTYAHAILHALFSCWCAGTFTLMMHNHVHHNGVLSKRWLWLDISVPYICGPLLGHTWNSYYYHHVKHHHVESNGPFDLSSTIHYDRDNVWHFIIYVSRFVFLIWLELPLYFLSRGQKLMALRNLLWEMSSYGFMYLMTTKVNAKAATFVFLIPFSILRLGLMIGNWGQHAFVDDIEPNSELRSSITLIDVSSNRFCFNDGYHTAHHLNPRRHWRDHPAHMVKSKELYGQGRALVFCNIDYLMLTVKLLQKDYMYLADCFVPIGDQISMSRQDIAALLKTKARRFSEAEIKQKFKDRRTATIATIISSSV